MTIERACPQAEEHVGHAPHAYYSPGGTEYQCGGLMFCPITSWNNNVQELVKYRTALEEIEQSEFERAHSVRKIAQEALGHGR